MPTRPVTWELDIPPASLLRPAGKTPVTTEVPSLQNLRKSLLGTRFEMLKVSTFATCLLAFLGLAIHGSHLRSSDNQFAGNAESTLQGLVIAVSHQAAAMRGKIEASALAMVHHDRNIAGHLSASAQTISSAVKRVQPHAHTEKHPPRAARPSRIDTASVPQPSAEARVPEAVPTFKSLLAPDSLAAGIIGLLLYMLFAVVLIRKRGGLRAFGDHQAI